MNYTMKWNELRRIAEEKGWYLLRNGGSHDIYAHAERNVLLKIERHGSQEIKHGLYCKLRKLIGF
jgi:predicted RNA binding protein YcfA (HicA-like mRNA interferase family)